MSGAFYGYLAFCDGTDSEGEDWFLEPRTVPPSSLPEALSDYRPGSSNRGSAASEHSTSRSRSGSVQLHRSNAVIHPARNVASGDEQYRRRHRQVRQDQQDYPRRQSSGQYLTVPIPLAPPPRHPGRQRSLTTSSHTSSLSSSPSSVSSLSPRGSPRHYRRRSSNVDGTTLSHLAANVISTTNNVLAAQVKHSETDHDNIPAIVGRQGYRSLLPPRIPTRKDRRRR